MIQKVLSFIKQHHMIERGSHILAGVSGGADSVCMLLILKELQKQLDCTVMAVHVEHGIRGKNSMEDAEFVKQLCHKMGIECRMFSVDAAAFARENKMSLEEGARELRYHCFAEAAEQTKAAKIAVAHNRNDCAETLLFHLARGTGLKGMCGIVPVRENIIRPLLCLERKEIESFLKERNQEYRTDDTNADVVYSRNKIRHQVLPVLEEINSSAVEHLYKSAALVSEAWELTVQLSEEAKKTCVEDNFLKEELLCLPLLIQKTVVLDVLESCAGSRKDISEIHITQVLQLLEKQAGKRLNLPYGMMAYRTYGGVRIEHNRLEQPTDAEPMQALELFFGQKTCIRAVAEGMVITCRVLEKTEEFCEIPKKTYTKWFDYDKIKGNVLLRKRCPKDYFVVDEKGSRQKLKKYFINEKIPNDRRRQILLLADGDHILWAVGYRISEAYKVTKDTKRILEVQISGGSIHE